MAILAFLLRMAYLVGARRSPLFENLGLDAKFYDRWAQTIAAGDWLGSDAFFMGPLYPYSLAVLYGLSGRSVYGVSVLQAGIDALTCALILLAARRVWASERAGLLAGVLACFYGPLMLYTGELLLPTLGTFLSALFLYLAVRSGGAKPGPLVLLTGIVLGVAALGKATVLVFYPVVVVWWMLDRPRPKPGSLVRPAVLLLLGVAMVVLPVTVRNRVVAGDWVLITSNAGLNFYIGNHASSSGAYLKPQGLDVIEDPEGRRIAEARWGRSLKPSEVSRFWFSEARDFLGRHPGRFVTLFAKKMAYFWGALELPQIENFNFQKRYSPLLRLPFPSFGWVVPLAVVGLVLGAARRRWAALPAALALLYSVTIAVFFVTGRYRMAVVPDLLVVSAGGILCLVEGLRAGRRGLLGVAILAAVAGLTHWNPYDVDPRSGFSEFEYRLGLAFEMDVKLEAAAAHYRVALAENPRHPGARLNLGVILARTGRAEEGRPMLEALAAEEPGNAKAHFNLGVVRGDAGEYEAAMESFARALAVDDRYVEAWHGYGVEHYRAGDLDRARDALARAVTLGQERGEDLWVRRSQFLLGKIVAAGEIRAGEGAPARMLRQGDVLKASADFSGAYEWYVRAGEAGRLPQAYFEAGSTAVDLERYSQAIEAFKRIIELDPGFRGAHFSMGAAYFQLQDMEAALREFEAEAGVNPTLPEVYLNLGLLYDNYRRDPRAALEAYERYIRLGGARAAHVRSRVEQLRAQSSR